jgi:metal-responsive CopG/Arc/MetJ family transcriptional regulator
MTRMKITISNHLALKLEAISLENDTTESEIFRKALTLFILAWEAVRDGKTLALIDHDAEIVTEFTGLSAASV